MRIISIIAITFIIGSPALSQTIDSFYIKNSLDRAIRFQKEFKPKQSLSILDALLPKAKNYYNSNHKVLGKIYFHMASSKLDLAKYEEAKSYLDQALRIFKLTDSVSLELGDTYMLIGIYYDYMTDYDKALAYYDLTKSIYLKLFSPNDFRFGYLYNNIGICIFFKGDIERALSFFNKTLAITVESIGDKSTKISRDLTNLSQCHTKLKKSSLALEKLSYSLNIAEQNKVLDSFIGARIFHALAIAYYTLKDYNKATENLNKAYQLRIKHLPRIHDEIASTYFMMANIQLELKDTTQAIDHLFKAKEIYTTIFGKDHTEVAIIQTNLASIYLKKKELNKALTFIDKALSIFDYDENISPTEKDKFNINILKALNTKAQILRALWINNKNVLQLKMANRIYTDLIYILNYFRKGFKEELSKEMLAGNFFHIFEDAIDVDFILYEATKDQYFIKDAFERCEYSTSFVLLEERRNAKAKNIAQIPDSLLKKEQQLRLDITFLEKKIREEEHKYEHKNQNKIVNYSSQVFDLKEELYNQVQILESKYPRYSHYKNDLSIVQINKLQTETLEEDQALVEYFVGEKNIFVFVITKDSFNVKRINKNFPLQSWIEELRINIAKFQYPFNLDSKYHQDIVEHSEGLYWEIVNPVEDFFKERIIIIPGGVLAEIPFEIFIKQTGDENKKYKQHQYLLKDYAISYCYSATMLDEMVSNKKAKSHHNTIAFAPTFNNFGQSGNLRDLFLVPLKFNTVEAKEISKIIGAKTIIGNEATEDYFIKEGPQYSIIHFATHAIADKTNSDYSFLAFSEVYDTLENELLFVKDIYNIPLQSEMVTLSACETGIGENRKGEGVISLARGFSFSGTSNINTSLWNVNDLRVSQLMNLFYKNIGYGLTKDEALRKAKLDFLANSKYDLDVHPFYWSAMIPIGDMRSMQIPFQWNPLLWFSAIVGILSLGWWLRNKKKLSFFDF